MTKNEVVHVQVCLPKELKKQLEMRAKSNEQSINAEIVFRIQDSLQKEDDVSSFERMKCWIERNK